MLSKAKKFLYKSVFLSIDFKRLDMFLSNLMGRVGIQGLGRGSGDKTRALNWPFLDFWKRQFWNYLNWILCFLGLFPRNGSFENKPLLNTTSQIRLLRLNFRLKYIRYVIKHIFLHSCFCAKNNQFKIFRHFGFELVGALDLDQASCHRLKYNL